MLPRAEPHEWDSESTVSRAVLALPRSPGDTVACNMLIVTRCIFRIVLLLLCNIWG